MITDALRTEYEHRFSLYDTDGDGYLTAQDFTERARRMADAAGEPPESPKAQAVHAGMRNIFEQLAALTNVGAEGRLDQEQFISAFVRASESGDIGRVVWPSIAATVALADTDDDGVVNRAEFTALQRATGFSDAQAEQAFAALDRDGDGQLKVAEYQAAMRE
ncbi:EF-hand domain-containing protein [Streptomyces sp. NPDC048595]|uniref:EF-hand domain-containing protein n=1 Tax=Streptomyces sp. NPDC048595 TaxID=3365576 RepID=UPI003715F395